MKNGMTVALAFLVMLMLMQAWGCTSNVAGPNRPPVAIAGVDRKVEVDQLVTLSGSDSFDPDGDELVEHQWDLLAMPSSGTALLVNADSVEVQLTPDAEGVWIAALFVTDSNGLVSERDVIQIRVEEQCDPEQEGPYRDDTCYDGVDNDCDGMTDGYDDDCQCAENVDCEDNEICVDGDCVPDPCLGELCSNNGTCNNSSGEKVCVCDPEYSGEDCELCANNYQDNDGDGICLMTCANPDLNMDCGHGDCTDVSGTPRCECDEGWAGPNCSTCAAGYHDDGLGNCVLDQECAQPNPRASCNMHGDCDDSSGVVVCTCDPAYAGPTCAACAVGYQDNDANGTCLMACSHPSSPVDCGDYGSCSDATGQAFCICDPGYAGVDCSACDIGYQDNDMNGTCLPTCANSGLNCGDHGSCSDASGFTICVCDLGYAGVLCGQCDTGYQDNDNDTICMPDCATSGLTCSNGGSCSDASGEALCVCINNWDPDFDCQQCLSGYQDNDGDIICLPDCATAELAGLDCGDYGHCEDTSGTAVCVCDLGYTGADCSSCDTDYQDNDGNNTCLPNCAISGLTCNAQSGGHCEDTSGTSVCVCDAGYHDESGTCVPDFPFPSYFAFTLGSPPIGFTESKSNIIEWSEQAVGGPAAQRLMVFRLDYDQAGDQNGEVTNVFLVRDGVDITDSQDAKAVFAHFNDGGDHYDLVALVFIQEDDYTTNQTKYYTLQANSTNTTLGENLTVTLLRDDVLTPSLVGNLGSLYDAADAIFTVQDAICDLGLPNFVWTPKTEPGGHVAATINYANCNMSGGTPDYADGFWLRDEMAGITVTIPRL